MACQSKIWKTPHKGLIRCADTVEVALHDFLTPPPRRFSVPASLAHRKRSSTECGSHWAIIRWEVRSFLLPSEARYRFRK